MESGYWAHCAAKLGLCCIWQESSFSDPSGVAGRRRRHMRSGSTSVLSQNQTDDDEFSKPKSWNIQFKSQRVFLISSPEFWDLSDWVLHGSTASTSRDHRVVIKVGACLCVSGVVTPSSSS